MDDSNFDKLIKDKLEGFEDPSFDESALAGFHEKLASVQPAPWYQQPFTHYLVAGSLAVFTVINILVFSPKESGNTSVSNKNKDQVKIDSLLTVIQDIKTKSILLHKKDSSDARGRIANAIAERTDGDNSLTIESADNSVAHNIRKSDNVSSASHENTRISKSKMVSLGPVNDLPVEVYQTLIRKGMLVDDNGAAYLSAPDRENYSYDSDYTLTGIKDVYRSPKFTKSFAREEEQKPDSIAKVTVRNENEISAEIKSELEKHYFKGIGINIGPHVDLSQGMFTKGKAPITPRFGFLAEIVTSPAISFEVGVDYSTTSIAFDRDFQTIEIPNLDTSLGTVSDANIKNTLMSTPLSIKYRKWISDKGQAFIRVGYTPYFSIIQEYQCGYKANYYPGGPQPYANHYVTSILQVKDNFFYGNTSSISLGLTRITRDKDKIEGSIFYESSLSAVGNEKVSMTLFGIRTAYWFNLK